MNFHSQNIMDRNECLRKKRIVFKYRECVSKKRIIIKMGGVVHGVLGSCAQLQSASKQSPCMHSTVINGTCMGCKKCMDNSYGFAFDYLLPGLRYSDEEVRRLKKRNTKCLLRKRKLHLVLDLDHTLLHSKRIKTLPGKDKYLEKHGNDSSLFPLDTDDGFLMKLRPFVRTFLGEASNIFDMYICTMGSRYYAQKVAKIIDPDGKYFNSKIVAREDFKQREKKNLNLVLGEESSTVILDDTESVWSDYAGNLIAVSRYDYFRDGEDDESESNGALANILRVLKTVHALYFDDPVCGDVRSYMAAIRCGILRGCTLYFSVDVDDFPLSWSRAEEMGATCTTVVDSSVSHIVSTETDDCIWAEQEEKFLVHPRWIDAAYFLWSRQPEDDYLP